MLNRSYGSAYLFVALVFVLSIPFWILGAVKPIQLLPGLPLSALQAFIPAIAALFLVYRRDGFPAVHQFLTRSFDFPRITNWKWYFPIVLINLAIAVLAYGFLRTTDPSLPDPAPFAFFVVPMTVAFFITAFGEELGWSGYATEPLLSSQGVLGTGLLLGAVWAVWHFIPLLQAGRAVAWIAWWSLGTIGLRLIMVWLFAYSGRSVFGAAVFHTMTNVCWQLFPVHGSHYDPRIFSLITFGFVLMICTAQYFLPDAKTQAPLRRS